MSAAAGLIAIFAIFAALMYARVVPALLAVPGMAIAMSLAVGLSLPATAGVIVTGAASLAPVYVTVIFGALLGRVTLDTGIARTIVNFAAEFGGENPLLVALLMCAVVAALFVSLAGLGAIIMVGTIVLPIMMTTGVPRKIAATLFLMAFALGYIFNIVNWKFYTQYFGVAQGQMYRYAIVLAAIDAIALVVYALVSFSRNRGYATWAVRAREPSMPGPPWFALITPVLPIVLYFALRLDPMLAFGLSALYGAVATRPRRAIETLAAAAIRGIEDVAPAIFLFIGIGMLLTATKQPQFASAIAPIVSAQALRNPLFYVVLFGLLSPLVLYRGPLNPFGVGIAVFTVMLSAHVLPAVIVVAAIMAVVQVQNVCDPTNTANVWIANYTGVAIVEITKRTIPYQVAVATIACAAVVIAPAALFAMRPFALGAARAATLPAGIFAGERASNRIAVGNDGSAAARSATAPVLQALSAQPQLRAFALQEDPNASDCTGKRYVAYVQTTSSRFMLIEGTDLDIGLRLLDCGGWEVDEWHEHGVFAQPSAENVAGLARSAAVRLLEWARSHPQRWAHLMSRGLAYADGAPSYYFALYKTVDGNMRAFVRAGGPAYESGLRSNDIVDKIDGLDWWEYGTYQAQARAYDGKPHRFEIERNGTTLTVQLGDPFPS